MIILFWYILYTNFYIYVKYIYAQKKTICEELLQKNILIIQQKIVICYRKVKFNTVFQNKS